MGRSVSVLATVEHARDDDVRRERHEALVTELAALDGQIEDSRSL